MAEKQPTHLTELSKNKCFDGFYYRYKHWSSVLGCDMVFTIALPFELSADDKRSNGSVSLFWWLSGLTCTDENFITKINPLRVSGPAGIAVVAPDTSPRGLNLPGETDSWDFGAGAGFYLNATQEPWSAHYKMFDYVVNELPSVLFTNFPFLNSQSQAISGHSMGGHGALVCALKNPGKYKSCSAFSPISNPSNVPWGQKAFKGYLGEDQSEWGKWDATHLVSSYNGPKLDVLADLGESDQFGHQLEPTAFKEAANKNSSISLNYRTQKGYNHSYFFVSTFFDDHFDFHKKHLSA
eukprot:TRINITY_DN1681_c0_g1_i1.p1 TRINITY_DN1681_c0_g1~~TRINITY_DN1681_c0_g1_i1.p1  ORF type:complete len:324 (-),score=86.39 TRINITY_DN1681_c0_g1_i1:93-977(-)